MGTAKRDKPEKVKKLKHKQHKEKRDAKEQELQLQSDAAKKHKKKKHQQPQQQQQQLDQPQGHAAAEPAAPAAPAPAPAAAAAAAAAAARDGSSSPDSSSEDLVVMTHQGSGQQAKTTGAKPTAAKTPVVNLTSSGEDESDSDVDMQEPTAATAAAAAASRQAGTAGARGKAARGSKAAGGKSLSEVLHDEGLVQCQVVGVQCELDLRGIQNPEHKELWVMRLPDGVSIDSLNGRHIHIPHRALPAARHLQPAPNPFHDPAADLLTHVQAALPAQEVGHMSLGAAAAKASHNHQHRELLQAHEFEAMTYSVLAAVPPTAGSSGSSGSSSKQQQQLQLLKVGRFIHLASDTPLVDKKRVREVSNAGATLWAGRDGWDGVLLPRHKPRRRLAGWEVEGGRRQRGSNDGSSSGDEEFEEVVFLQTGEEQQRQQQQQSSEESSDESSSGPDSDSDSDAQQRKSKSKRGSKQQQGSAGAGAGGGLGELHPRFYSDADSDSEAEAQQQQQLQGDEEDRPLPGGMQPPFAADLQQWLLSLPVLGRVQMLQTATAQIYSSEQWAADRRAWWQQAPQNAYLAPNNTALQERLLQQLADSGSSDISSSESESESEDDSNDVRVTRDESGGDDINPDDIIVVEELGEQEEDDEDGSTAAAAAAASLAGGAAAAVTAYAADEAKKEYPCALPLPFLVTLPQQVEDALGNIRGVRRRQRLRNAAVLLFTDWREVWMQVDKDFLSDDELWQWVQALPSPLRQQIQVHMDNERLRRVQARKQTAKTLGQQMVVAPPGPRPRYTATDQGYAPYQAARERRVFLAPDNTSADAEDAAVADWLVSQGAGHRVKLLGADELRNRGLDWDTDALHLRREGLHVVLPDGRDVHIPAGTDLDWQGELRRAWGFDGQKGSDA